MRHAPVLVVTRPAPKGEAFARAVCQDMARPPRVILSPAFAVQPTGAAVPGGDVIFTSARAVDIAPPGTGTAWCVGDATAQAAEAKGWTARSARGDVEALVTLILSMRPAGPLTHLAGAQRRGDIARRLTQAGVRCETVELYTQVPLAPATALLDAAREGAPLVAPVFSPRSVAGLALAGRVAPLHIVAISAAVAHEAQRLNAERVLTAARPDAVHMLEATTRALADCGP
ncbi:uroporphyrinogen-III synthase [Salipiger sp. IMCC34102]|uniref:uroporphyrinogen-III synthase n=1 Tax=Salipiger sp. IMCC34102 TaxID=2510647 RepID=UPI00101C62E8|nr:uroporphyrinogen-III synthase [Salipiger sp. IMCC34102]RYH04247.1 uroporphyrinogen-III synthase [Salipiger sp. IMCC34102]